MYIFSDACVKKIDVILLSKLVMKYIANCDHFDISRSSITASSFMLSISAGFSLSSAADS